MAPRAIFIGMPGAGKSTVGRRVAKELGAEFRDSDELIVERTGRSIDSLFATLGENGFRQIEADAIAWAIREFDGVLALGGGAVLHPGTRSLLADQQVVLIEASDDELVRRVTHSRTIRPLLKNDPRASIKRLRRQRSTIYHSVASYVVLSDARPVGRVVDEVVEHLTAQLARITVRGDVDYDVTIGSDLASEVVRLAATRAGALVVFTEHVRTYADAIITELKIADVPVHPFVIPPGEESKTAEVLIDGWRAAGDAGLGRDGVVIAVGGGATTDMAGFLAATWLRGVPVIQVPTTLLAMVDAAVGGKTGINSDHGKNMVGAFHPPLAVFADVGTLATLDEAEIRAGMGEVAKCGFIADDQITRIIRESSDPTTGSDLFELISRSVQVKADIVSADLRESGQREFLNYGHTLAHAIELSSNYSIRHGEAVAIGCVFAAALSVAAGIGPAGLADHHREILLKLGLPVSHSGVSRQTLLDIMYSDKKVRSGQLRFVVLSELGSPQILVAPSEQQLDAAFTEVGL
ncbi:3-dehydroquinate synthase [Trueperella bialowiezensis]|uniref:Multifunctional fusion protein n=1 Tax=Trueperella bialowiezensis TaxID=312285 RepID=A0A3S4VS02_9ACTO|nr:3-dehydroquinate synthase [Trueperella bialowiezensis]VEI12453.1 3-dehydroquinate synthase [Trueperella bialowiezensis]